MGLGSGELKHCARRMLPSVLPITACRRSDMARAGFDHYVHMHTSDDVLLLLRDGTDLGSQERALRLLHCRVKAKAPVNLRAPSDLQPMSMSCPESRARALQPCFRRRRKGKRTSRMSLSTCAIMDALSFSAFTEGAPEGEGVLLASFKTLKTP